jgi:CDGSH-type Zn-finger protein
MTSPERHRTADSRNTGTTEPHDTAREHGATVVPYEDGPLILRGDFSLQSPDGTVIEPGRTTVALCRCGKSAIKPFCDGTHKAIGFRAGPGRDTAAPRAAA